MKWANIAFHREFFRCYSVFITEFLIAQQDGIK